jgi:5-methylcytosine-specific restriction protein B
MNIADRSLAIVDMALRRRFAFFDMQPLFNDRWKAWLSDECGIDKGLIGSIESKVRNLNDEIESEPGLGPQFTVGHSFFSPGANSEVPDPINWYQ